MSWIPIVKKMLRQVGLFMKTQTLVIITAILVTSLLPGGDASDWNLYPRFILHSGANTPDWNSKTLLFPSFWGQHTRLELEDLAFSFIRGPTGSLQLNKTLPKDIIHVPGPSFPPRNGLFFLESSESL